MGGFFMGKISASENQPLNDHGLIMVDHHPLFSLKDHFMADIIVYSWCQYQISRWLEVEIYRTTKFILSLILSIVFIYVYILFIEGSLEVKLPTIWTDDKQSREEAERRGRLEERRVEEIEYDERRCRCAKR
jgi:hypothetical protein